MDELFMAEMGVKIPFWKSKKESRTIYIQIKTGD